MPHRRSLLLTAFQHNLLRSQAGSQNWHPTASLGSTQPLVTAPPPEFLAPATRQTNCRWLSHVSSTSRQAHILENGTLASSSSSVSPEPPRLEGSLASAPPLGASVTRNPWCRKTYSTGEHAVSEPLTPSSEPTWQDFARTVSQSDRPEHKVKQLLLSEPFASERRTASQRQASIGWRHLHGRLLFALLARRGTHGADGHGSRRKPPPLRLRWSRTAAAAFRLMQDQTAPGCFQLHFLADLAYLAGLASRPSLIDRIHLAARQVLEMPRWRQRLQAHADFLDQSNAAKELSCEKAETGPDQLRASPSQLSRIGRVYLSLMAAYGKIGKYDKVQQSFDELRETRVAPTIQHYQLQLLAIFAHHIAKGFELAGPLERRNAADKRTLPRRISDDVSELRRCMDMHGVEPDDTFLASIVHGFGAPLRSPLSHALPNRAVHPFLGPSRSFVDAFLDRAVRSSHRMAVDSRAYQSEMGLVSRTRARLLDALIQVELDALRFTEQHKEQGRLRRIQGLIQCAAEAQASAMTAIGSSTPSLHQSGPSSAAAGYIQARVLAGQARLDAALSILPALLEMPKHGPSEDGPGSRSHRDHVLRRRSIVIMLFSSAIKVRHSSRRRDYAFEVLDAAVRHESFAELWKERVEPTGWLADSNPDDRDPHCTWNRLWKRYLRAWSSDVANGRSSTGSRASTEPWKVLSDCITSITFMLGRLQRSRFHRRPFDTLVSEKGLVRAMLHAAAVGGRWTNDQTPDSATRSVARIDRVLRLFSLARVRPRIWSLARSILVEYGNRQERPQLAPSALAEVLRLLNEYSRDQAAPPADLGETRAGGPLGAADTSTLRTQGQKQVGEASN
ncbi:uncharacterized protein PFL1_01336 [Pseudozyma flocculosa PF-1]|uniref:Uncharacterized protein n=1 Tax=Pseudozyma flocculosa TaxID=84751 RepID=A0A5C3EVS3_9BASI|nr:uncharacterized protein PFL1_01336 [Pseudozyma flocculosa PF-1]EPQ31147.1 hypothetical protein PFL1_01336 [Pseudozyma flocculosa PF-1]SPO36364.1 uncharacterized protein PSFLO_01835 [Pseudozyma flocculosa]